MRFGVVKYYDLKKGFGVIEPDDLGEEVIVDEDEVRQAGLGQLAARQRLGFELSGRRATNLWATFGNR